MRTLVVSVVGTAVLFWVTGTASAADIRGTISSPLTITEDSQLVGNVTCTVTGAACITFGASGISLRLNGFSMTGQADQVTGCGGVSTAGEAGILITGMRGVVIQGPGVVQRFRNAGIRVQASSRVRVSLVTVSTNCTSGILVGDSVENEFDSNISVRNGNTGAGQNCGGI
jgi:hypothetical protein